ncbi:MAG: hypothetical protein J6S67_18190 [Methanobrevibacter sp.]|nr:hypothetical protein [Methanobrevibacter sp.]
MLFPLLEQTVTTVQFSDFSSLMSLFTTQFSVANIVAVLSGVLGASVGFVFLWWGARHLYRAIVKAATRGKPVL